MNLRDAAQQALEALVASGLSGHKTKQAREAAITALRAALAKDAAETNFGIMAQVVDPTDDAHIADANKMVATSQESRQVEPEGLSAAHIKSLQAVDGILQEYGLEALVFLERWEAMTSAHEPVAWMVYTLDGQSAFITDNPANFTPEHRALPLFTAPPKREPLTEAFLEELAEKHVTHCYFDTLTYARAIERAHGIGGEE